MSGRHSIPRAGSRAQGALTGLHRVGGRADLHAWMNSCKWSETINEFHKVIIDRLQFLRMVEFNGDVYVLTRAGLQHIDVDADAPMPPAPVVVGPRTFVSSRTLAAKHMIRMPLMREGAHDYAAIPSRMGDVVKPHLAGEALTCGKLVVFGSKA